MNRYSLNANPIVSVDFADEDGDAANPTAVTLVVTKPDATTASYTNVTLDNPAVGTWSKTLVANQAGTWAYTFTGTGAVAATSSGSFSIGVSLNDPWVDGASLTGDLRLAEVALPASVTLDDCAEAATDFLYARSGRRFRLHDAVVRPNQSGWCGSDGTEIDLPSPVVAGSVVVTIDGVVLSTSAYRLDDGHLLVRTDGDFWPLSSSLSSPSGTDWSIAFTHGEAPWMSGVLACRELAVHVALALSGKPSKIPARATSLSRGGLSINLMRGAKTGIPLVDDFLTEANPNNLMGRGSVVSPDTIRLSSIG